MGASLAVFSILRTPWAGFEELVFLGAIPIGALLGLLLSPLIARDGLPAATRAFFLTIPVVAIAGAGPGCHWVCARFSVRTSLRKPCEVEE